MNIKILDSNNKIYHRVVKNEDITSISKTYSVNSEFIKSYNGLKNNEIEEGDILVIPRTKGISHIVKPRDTLESIAKTYGVSVEYLIRVNRMKNVFIGQKIFI